ncbi:MAG TPA: hypothetical protein VF457_15755 [Burkholderiaceae bacterium]
MAGLQAPSAKPRYRADIQGLVAETKADCETQIRSEIASSDNFILLPEDTGAWWDFADTLTESEIRACFKRATRAVA